MMKQAYKLQQLLLRDISLHFRTPFIVDSKEDIEELRYSAFRR